MPPALLEITDLHIERDVPILRGISWRVERGQHWVILGPNGCGKTSLLKALLAYLVPTSGQIALFGKKFGATDWRELRLHLGLVTSALHHYIPPAEPAIETVISGKYAQLDLWRKVTATDRTQARRILRKLGSLHLADRAWLHLSQGERQRILIGRALMARPRLLILDEPCAGLDPVARERFLGFMQKFGRQPGAPALILVTHHVEEIVPAFSHVLVLKAGRVLAAGPKRTVLTSRTLSAAFDAPAHLTRRAGRYRLTFRPGRTPLF